MVLEHDSADILAPDVEHCSVDNVSKGTLGIIGDCLAEGLGVGAPTMEVSTSACEGGEDAGGPEFVLNPLVPQQVRWKCSEVLRLKLTD